jgi:hypothetical protein
MTERRTTPASLDFTKTCNVCGETVTVAGGIVQPHKCRIDLDAQRNPMPDRDGYESAAQYAAERKAAQPWDQTVMHYIASTDASLTPCGIDPNEWRPAQFGGTATIKSTSNRDWVSCPSCLLNLDLRDTQVEAILALTPENPNKDTAQISLNHGMALAGILPEAPARRLAHHVAPDPITVDHYYGGYRTTGPRRGGIVSELAKYHAARAQGFWLAMQEDPSTQHIMLTLDAYHIAALYHLMTGEPTNEQIARLNTSMRWEPEQLGPAIWELCQAYGVDPDSISPYMMGK